MSGTALDAEGEAAAAAIDAEIAKGNGGIGKPGPMPAEAPAPGVQGAPQQPSLDFEGEAAAQKVDAFSGTPGSGTQTDPYQGIINFTKQVHANYTGFEGKVKEAWQVGQDEMRESAIGHEVAEGKTTLEQANQRIAQDNAAKWRAKDVSDYEKQRWPIWGQALLASGTMEGVKSLPQMAEYFTSPTEPIDYATGGTMGPIVHQGRLAMHYVFGSDYLRRRNLGASHDEAVHFAGANAIANGVVQMLSNVPWGGMGLQAAKGAIGDVALPLIVKAATGIIRFTTHGTVAVAGQELIAEAGTVIRQAIDGIEATVHDRPDMMPKLETAAKEWGDTFNKTLGMGLILHTAGHTAGTALGTLARAVNTTNKIHLQKQQAKMDKIAELKQQTQLALQGHVEEDVHIKAPSEVDRAKAKALVVFREQKERLSYQEGKLTALDDEIKRRSRKGEDTTELAAKRDELMKDTKLLSEIVDAEESNRLKEAQARLDRVMNQTKIDASAGSKTEREQTSQGKPDTQLQQALDLARHFKEHPQKAADLIAQQAQEDAAGKPVELKEGDQLIRDVANLVGDVREKDSEQLNELSDQVELAFGTSRKARLKQIAKRNAARDARVLAVKTAMQLKGEVSASVNRQKKPTITLAGTLRNGVIGVLGNWEQLWYPVLRGMDDWKQFYDDWLDPGKIINTVNKGQRHWNERRFDLMAEVTGKTRAQVLELQRMGRRKNQVTFQTEFYKDHNGRQVQDDIGLSAMEAVKVLGEARNDKLKTRFLNGNHFPENFEKQIKDQLDQIDPAYAKMPDGYIKWYEEYGVGLNDTHMEHKGVPMKKEANYAGYVSAIKNEEVDRNSLVAQLESGYTNTTKVKGKPEFLEERTAGQTTGIAPQDAEQAARAATSLGERYKGWFEPSREVFGPILRDRGTRTMIRNKAGSFTLNMIDRGYDWLLNGSARNEIKWGNFLDTLFSSIRFNTMANNWLYAPEHALSSIAGAQYIPIFPYLRGMADFYLRPDKLMKNVNNITKNSDIWQSRYEDVEGTVSGSSLPRIAQNPNMPKIVNDLAVGYGKFGMASIEHGSKAQVLSIMHSAYQYFKSQKMTDEEAMYKAGMIAENVATSMRPDLTSQLAHTGIGKYALMFQQQMNKFGVDQLIAADRFLANPNTENFQHFIKTQVVTTLAGAVFPIVRESYNYLSTDDRDQKDDAFFHAQMAAYHLFMPGSMMFGAGQATDYLMTAYHNAVEGTHTPLHEFSIPAMDVTNKNEKFAGTLMDHWANGKWEDEDNKMMGALLLQGPGALIPLGLKAPAGLLERVLDK